jgi:hypothetical protein
MRGRWARLGGAAAAAVVLLAASGCGAGEQPPRTGTAQSWRQLAASPLAARVGHSAVWTGGELLIWGGGPIGARPLADGAAYDPAADRWRRLSRNRATRAPTRPGSYQGMCPPPVACPSPASCCPPSAGSPGRR